MAGGDPVRLQGVSHYFGRGDLRKRVLDELDLEIAPGEIVILTGPSGSGKTTALTLIGALRAAQEGSVRVLGEELRGAREADLVGVRRRVGYIFQHHNLLDSLTSVQNVQMSLDLVSQPSRREARRLCLDMLEQVGMGEHGDKLPSELSGGQRQRVAIARALVSGPSLVLADEPTASLDRESGREAVAMIERLARDHAVPVVLVTHDNRILDVADRIVHLEDGRLSSLGDAILANTKHMMSLLAEDNRRGQLARKVATMSARDFQYLLRNVTQEAEEFLRVTQLSGNEAFDSMLEQALEAFTHKIGDLLQADRASIFLLDEERGELWSKGARDAAGALTEIRIQRDSGIAGAVMATGESVRVTDAASDPRFNDAADRQTGYRTRSILCIPLRNREQRCFGVAQILNRLDGEPFNDEDEKRFAEFMTSVAVILESWWEMSRTRADTKRA
ncbi:MAG: ATP-binding cassette domain-containing protein [Myxococcota bacterium]|nr:ATP-binding cassette domain-containing protein [Myxococcota bacterium]